MRAFYLIGEVGRSGEVADQLVVRVVGQTWDGTSSPVQFSLEVPVGITDNSVDIQKNVADAVASHVALSKHDVVNVL